MNTLSRVSSYAACLLGRETHFLNRSSLYPKTSTFSWEGSVEHGGLKTLNLNYLLTRIHSQCYSSRSASGKNSKKKKSVPQPVAIEKEKDAFFVIRKGDVVGVYKSLDECRAQVGSSVSDPPVSIFKGNCFSVVTGEYLTSRGLQNALYTIRAEDLKEDLFGQLVPCTIQKRASLKEETSKTSATEKGSMEALELQTVEADGSTSGFTDPLRIVLQEAGGSTSASTDPLRKHFKVDNEAEVHSSSHDHDSCVLEFDGASKGNPGQAGAGAVLWAVDGSPICRLRKGLGHKTNNVAEYEALILGLEHALKKGYTKIRVIGDSKLVCFQLQGKWKVRHWMMSILYEQAKTLENKFVSFQINHFLREHNSEADAQANLATKLGDGEVEEELCT